MSDAQQKMDVYDEKRQEEELVTTIIQTLSISFGQSDQVWIHSYSEQISIVFWHVKPIFNNNPNRT